MGDGKDTIEISDTSSDGEKKDACLPPAGGAGGSSSGGRGGAGGGGAGRSNAKKPARERKRPADKAPAEAGKGKAGKKQRAAKKAPSKVSLAWTDEDEDGDNGSSGAAAEQPGMAWEEWVQNPPASMQFSTNLCAPPPKYWAEKKGGTEAANLLDSMEICRLIGTIDLEFECIQVQGKIDENKLAKLHAPVKPSCRQIVGKGAGVTHLVRWNSDGEPGSRSCYTVQRLLRGCHTGLLLPTDAATIAVLDGLVNLSRPEDCAAVPWSAQPLLRTVCPIAGAKREGNTLTVRAWVYIRRLLFEMIAYPPLMTVMQAMKPASPVRRTAELPALAEPVFFSHMPTDIPGRPSDYAFSLAGVMKAQEHSGYRAAEQPHGLKMQMKEYQLQTLAWMLDREALPHGLNELFWEKWSFSDGAEEEFFYAPQLGELRLQQPLVRRGGILSEEMGLGKTIEILALILATKADARKQQQAAAGLGEGVGSVDSKVLAHGGTLIVVPVHLVSQWLYEIDKAAGSALVVTKYTAENKLPRGCALEPGGKKECADWESCPGREGHLRRRICALASSADIVLTTYGMLKDESTIFNRIRWARVVLDEMQAPPLSLPNPKLQTPNPKTLGAVLEEMQEIRSSTTDHARACEKLNCDCRWMVSGTPLYTSIDDLNGELAFLGVLPFCAADNVDGFWNMRVSRPFKRRKAEALALLNCLLRGVMIRHSKSQTYSDGSSILALPSSRTRRVPVEQTPSEKYLYQFLELKAAADLDAVLAAAGNAARLQASSSSALRAAFWLRVLRESCVSPFLINGGAGCTTQTLRDVDFRLRSVGMGSIWQIPHGVAPGDPIVGYDPKTVRSLTAGDALKLLMQGRDISETARHHRNNHMVRHGNVEQGVYDRNRSYAMPTIQERLVEVGDQRQVHYERINIARRYVPLVRWRWALECITSGRYWDSVSPHAHFPLRFLRRAFAAIRLNQAFAQADEQLQKRAAMDMREREQAPLPVFEGVEYLDRNKLKQALTNALPTGMRVVRVRALETYAPETAEELAFRKDDVITLVATSEAGWKALGFSLKQWPLGRLAPSSFFSNDHRPDAASARGDDFLLLGTVSSVCEDPPPPQATGTILNQLLCGPKTVHELWDSLEVAAAEAAASASVAAAAAAAAAGEAGKERDHVAAGEGAGAAGGAGVSAAAAAAAAARSANPFFSKNGVVQSLDYLRRKRWVLRSDKLVYALSAEGIVEQERAANATDRMEGGLGEVKQFKVSGEIGIVHSRMVRVLGGSGGRTSRVDIPSGRVASLREDQSKVLREMMSQAVESLAKLKDLDPYLAILQRAHAAGAGQSTEDTIQQSGFQQLYEIELGQSPKCCVCQEGCGYEQKPTYMRCAHFACEECLVRWAMYERSKNLRVGNILHAGAGAIEATCPLCRKAFCLSDLIRIVKPPESKPAAHSGTCSDKGKQLQLLDDTKPDDPTSQPSRSQLVCPPDEASQSNGSGNEGARVKKAGEVRWLPTATEESLARIEPPAGGILPRSSIEGLANFPSFTPELGSHLIASTGTSLAARAANPPVSEAHPPVFASKVRRLLADLAEVTSKGEKAVVFTQYKQAVYHLARIFSDPGVGVGFVKIVGGDPQWMQERAVKYFNEQANVSVFLLHAGQAAAGLTLTAASHVFLMEPFMKTGEQAQAVLQAMNRCHRIGQTKDVTCTLYYAPETIEERLEAWKEMDGADEGTGSGETDALSVLDHEKQNMSESLFKMRYLLGVAAESPSAADQMQNVMEIDSD